EQVQRVTSFGAAHVFDLSTGGFVATLANPTPQTFESELANPDLFGDSVASLPDGKFLVSDYYDDADPDNGPFDSGRAWVFTPDAPANQPPTAGIVTPVSGAENSTITLSSAASSDPDNDITTYLWDLDSDTQYDDATGPTANFSQDLPGSYTVGLKVID